MKKLILTLVFFLPMSANAGQKLPDFYLPDEVRIQVNFAQKAQARFSFLDRDTFQPSQDCFGMPVSGGACFLPQINQYFQIGSVFYQIRSLFVQKENEVALAIESVDFPGQWMVVRTGGKQGFRLNRVENDREIVVPLVIVQ